MSMTLSTTNYSTTLGVPQFNNNFVPIQQPGSQLLESLAGLFSALAPLLQGLGFQGNPMGNRFGNNFQQNFGPQGFPQGFGPQGFPQGFGPQGFPQGFGPQGFPQGFGAPMGEVRAKQVLNQNWALASKSNDGKGVTRESLTSALNDPAATPEFREAASFFLNNDVAFKNLDRANATKHGNFKQKADGWVASVDMHAALSNSPTGIDNISEILNRNWSLASRANNGNGITLDSLRQAMNDPSAPLDFKLAAQHLLDNPTEFTNLDRSNATKHGNFHQKPDGWIASVDLHAALPDRTAIPQTQRPNFFGF
jgi:hypothetical protein